MSWITPVDLLNKGGWVAYALAFLAVILWYAVGYRYLFLRSRYLRSAAEEILSEQKLQEEDLLGEAALAIKGLEIRKKGRRAAIQIIQKDFLRNIMAHKQTIRAVVIVAPLLGLLGTVIGMIETFDSLQDSALFSQSGGIAGGISQALITTQMGLVVAIPGLLIGRFLNRREEKLGSLLEQMIGFTELKGERP